VRRSVAGLVGLAAVAVLGVLVLGGSDGKYVVYAKFADAGGILQNYNVKVGQVAAGHISDITLDGHDNAVVKMELDHGAVPIGAGASAKVRPVNLLGEKYVDLDPGDLKRPLPSGTTIPVSRTGSPIELDDALNILDPDTRGALRIIINEAGLAMAGRGTDFNRTLSDLPPALDAARKVVGEVDAENASLRSLITSGDRVLATVTPKSGELGELVSSAADALTTAAQRREALGATVDAAPAALTHLRTTLAKLQAASGQLTPAADDLRASAPALTGTLKRLPALEQDARATLAQARKVAPQLSRLGRRSAPTLRALAPTADRVARFSADVAPLLDTLDRSGGGTNALLAFINGWAGVTDGGDALGHVFRLRPTVDTGIITTLLEGYLGDPLGTGKKPSKAPAGKAGAGPPPAGAGRPPAPAPAAPAKAPAQPLDGLKPITGAVGKTLDGAAKLLDYLLGP
jgi:phospholipid/cholesterol/gamma-HCH transport system substrate-binding protein